jgi:fatty-acyl-CoA synthase
MDANRADRLYNVLPLYHSVGGIVAVGSMLAGGASVVIRERFSAGRFWEDVQRWDCTLFQYIGELCRYLLRAPAAPQEAQHRLRMACGNGLRADIWSDFQQRFHIPHIFEFFASTEGNVSLFNVEGTPGAIGRIPPFLGHRFPTRLIKLDQETGAPLRDALGMCISCPAGEAGEAVGRIATDTSNIAGGFEGYTRRDATEAKILRNVAERGDAWFRTGDLMRKDERGYFYFIDRLGDTFRWKGENVSTSEVAAVLCSFPGVTDACVYGVAVPGADGRAGMAALVADHELDLKALRQHLSTTLPRYARPIFLRMSDAVEVTSTFKHAKREFAHQGFDPAAVSDPVYFDNGDAGAYVLMDAEAYARIRAGELLF